MCLNNLPTTCGQQAPLFPALEIIAVYNGFHHMDKVTLERHRDRIGDALISQAPRRASEYEETSSVCATIFFYNSRDLSYH